jgi:gamma-glutamylaminecyclotransferase
MITLFIYGTLKRSQAAHHLLAGQRFLGEARTAPLYRIVDLGPYPTLVDAADDGLACHGEHWQVDAACLARLDDYEGAPVHYCRRPVTLQRVEVIVFGYFKVVPPRAGLPSGDCWPIA